MTSTARRDLRNVVVQGSFFLRSKNPFPQEQYHYLLQQDRYSGASAERERESSSTSAKGDLLGIFTGQIAGRYPAPISLTQKV